MKMRIAAIIGISIVTILTSAASAVYNPKLGRFAQRDPVGYVDGMNVYEYVRSSPIGKLDPRGLWSEDVHGGKYKKVLCIS